jgi:hypothetical protein
MLAEIPPLRAAPQIVYHTNWSSIALAVLCTLIVVGVIACATQEATNTTPSIVVAHDAADLRGISTGYHDSTAEIKIATTDAAKKAPAIQPQANTIFVAVGTQESLNKQLESKAAQFDDTVIQIQRLERDNVAVAGKLEKEHAAYVELYDSYGARLERFVRKVIFWWTIIFAATFILRIAALFIGGPAGAIMSGLGAGVMGLLTGGVTLIGDGFSNAWFGVFRHLHAKAAVVSAAPTVIVAAPSP